MAFDLSEALKDVSIPNTGRERFAYLPYASLIPDPKNGYSMDGIEELARNIEVVGLQQPLRVKELGADSYGLISGHRRHAAIGLILQRDPGAFADGVPCVIDAAGGSLTMRELQLLLANADNRKLTPADELQQAERVSDCIRRLEDEGYQFPGRHRDWVSKLSGLSRTKIARLDAIRHNLVPELRVEFDAGCLGETVAYRISQEAATVQADLAAKLGPAVRNLTVDSAEKVIDHVKKAPAVKDREPDVGKSIDTLKKYIDARNKEDDDFFEMLNGVAEMLTEPLGALNSRSEGIEKLKTEFGKCWRGGWNGKVDYECRPKGLTLETHSSGKSFRTWTEVYDMLCTIALNRAANGCTWDEDEEDEPEEEVPTVRWESRAITPPQREPLLLYQLTNAGPKYTPAVYCGGATFRKPSRIGEGAELTGIAQQFTQWIKLPRVDQYGETFRVAPPDPVSSADTAPSWRTGEPEAEGVYCCKINCGGDIIYRVARWLGGAWNYVKISGVIGSPVLAWYPLPPEED